MVQAKKGRENGLTDRAIIFEMVKDGVPGDVFPYVALEEVLEQGLDVGETVTRHRVQSAVRDANEDLLHARSRYLEVGRNVGYCIVKADDQTRIGDKFRMKGWNSIHKGFRILRNTRTDEMSGSERARHDALINIVS